MCTEKEDSTSGRDCAWCARLGAESDRPPQVAGPHALKIDAIRWCRIVCRAHGCRSNSDLGLPVPSQARIHELWMKCRPHQTFYDVSTGGNTKRTLPFRFTSSALPLAIFGPAASWVGRSTSMACKPDQRIPRKAVKRHVSKWRPKAGTQDGMGKPLHVKGAELKLTRKGTWHPERLEVWRRASADTALSALAELHGTTTGAALSEQGGPATTCGPAERDGAASHARPDVRMRSEETTHGDVDDGRRAGVRAGPAAKRGTTSVRWRR